MAVRIIKKEHWWIAEGETKPGIECPVCGCGNLGDAAPHGVRADGTVFNSVVCQTTGCGFHEYIKLEGWPGTVIPHK